MNRRITSFLQKSEYDQKDMVLENAMGRFLLAATFSVLATTTNAETKVEFGNMRLEPVQVRAAQQALIDLGFNPGPVDGALGSKTITAFAEFAATRGFENDGAFGENEVALLRAAQYNAAHLNNLTSLPLPTIWDINMLSETVLRERSRQGAQLREEFSGMAPQDMPSIWKANCVEVLSSVDKQVLLQHQAQKKGDEVPFPMSIQGCLAGLGKISTAYGQENGFLELSNILKEISRNDYLVYLYSENEPELSNKFYYEYNAVTSVIAAHYFIYYDEYRLTSEDRNRIDIFLTRALQYDFDHFREPGLDNALHPLCRRESIDLVGWNPYRAHNGEAVVLPNACDSARWKLAVAQILGGLRLSNPILWELGKFNVDLKLNLFNEDNIDVPWAAMRGHAIDYNSNVAEFLGVLTEVFYSADFDLLSYKNEGGATVADLQRSYWEFENSQQIFRDSPFYELSLRDYRTYLVSEEMAQSTLKDLFWINGRNAYVYAIFAHRYAARFDSSILPFTTLDYLKSVWNEPTLMLPTNGDTFRIIDPELLYLANEDRDK